MSDYEGTEHETRDASGPVTEEAFDRMVDGELSDTERRELLGSLDRVKHGWRKLALAYVEAQTWRNDLGAMVRPASETTPETSMELAQPANVATKSDRLKLLLAMAASFLIALVIGFQFRGGDGSPSDVAGSRPSADGPLLAQPDTALVPDSTMLTTATEPAGTATPTDAIEPSAPRGTPVFNVGSDARPSSASPAVPPNIAEVLRRLQHRVERRRSLVPVETEDGRRIFIPVEDIEVEYVGDDAYQ